MAYSFFKKLEDGSPTGNLYILKNLQQVHPTVDFGDPAAIQTAGYCIHLNTQKPTFEIGNYDKEWINNGDVAVAGETNTYDHDWQLVTKTMTAEELADEKARAWNELRDYRKFLLRVTDRFAVSDVTMSAEMTTYRQSLRDLPSNTTDPFNVTWPTMPDEFDIDAELQAFDLAPKKA